MPELQGHGHPVTQSYHRSSLLDTTKHVDLMFQKRFLSHPKRLTIVRHCQGQRGMFFLTKYQQQWKESKLNLSKNSFKKIRKGWYWLDMWAAISAQYRMTASMRESIKKTFYALPHSDFQINRKMPQVCSVMLDKEPTKFIATSDLGSTDQTCRPSTGPYRLHKMAKTWDIQRRNKWVMSSNWHASMRSNIATF